MKICIIKIGKTKNPSIGNLLGHYRKMLNSFWKIDEKIIKESKGSSKDEIIMREGENLIKSIPSKSFAIALSEEGTKYDSKAFSSFLCDREKEISSITFILGGAFGLSENVKKKVDFVISLSHMTFPHEIAELLLFEQLYRAGAIIKNKTYHY